MFSAHIKIYQGKMNILLIVEFNFISHISPPKKNTLVITLKTPTLKSLHIFETPLTNASSILNLNISIKNNFSTLFILATM